MSRTQHPIPERTESRDFDLNIEKVLEGWMVSHAVREIIANALDEQALTGTAPVEIKQDGRDTWRIRDFGRGLRYTHLTQNENLEKQQRESEVIGRFGVGLKDALAVFDRRGVRVVLRSVHGEISLVHRAKSGFSDVTTLHARVSPPSNAGMVGTEVILSGVDAAVIHEAKRFFLRFSGEEEIESTKFGQVLKRGDAGPARIFVKGLVVAEEADFAFSYNVTALTQAMRRALNRERTNVGRTAYADRVKAMLLASESEAVADVLARDLANLAGGTSHDEVRNWNEVGIRACQILNAKRRVVFVTSEQLVKDKEMIDRAIEDGRDVITVPGTIATKLSTVKDVAGNALQSISRFAMEWSASVEFKFIPEDEMTTAERSVFRRWKDIAVLAGGLPRQFKELRVSETMRPSVAEGMNPLGLWEAGTGRVVVHRPVLQSLASFAGTFLHELTHAKSGYDDVSRDFECALTDLIGKLSARALTPDEIPHK